MASVELRTTIDGPEDPSSGTHSTDFSMMIPRLNVYKAWVKYLKCSVKLTAFVLPTDPWYLGPILPTALSSGFGWHSAPWPSPAPHTRSGSTLRGRLGRHATSDLLQLRRWHS